MSDYAPIITLGVFLAIACGFILRRFLQRERERRLSEKYGSDVAKLIMARKVAQGMTTEMLEESWGAPADIDKHVYKTKTKETWKYNQTGRNRFRDRVYLEDGHVVGWKDTG